MNDKILRFLGLARRAGCLTYGMTAVKVEIEKSRCKLIVLASDLKDNSRKDLLSNIKNIKILEIPHTKEEIGYAIGAKPTGIVSINDDNFKKGIIEVNYIEIKEKNN